MQVFQTLLRTTSLLFASFLITTYLAGCAHTNQQTVDQLKAEVDALKKENASLKGNQSNEEQSTEQQTEQFKEPQFTDIAEVPTQAFIHDLAMIEVLDPNTKTFEPYKPITRGEFVTWLFKSYNKLMPANSQLRLDPGLKPLFKDIAKDHPAYPYAQALANAGFSVGYQDGTFKPDQPITREEMITIKVGVDHGKEVPASDSSYFEGMGLTDKNVDQRYKAYIWTDENFRGALGNNRERAFGKSRTFKPKEKVLRHEAAAVLWEFGQYDNYTAAKLLGNQSQAQKLVKQ